MQSFFDSIQNQQPNQPSRRSGTFYTDMSFCEANKVASKTHNFSRLGLLTGVDNFLKNAGYEPLHATAVNPVAPDIYARRSLGDKTFDIVGLVCMGLEQAGDGIARLAAIQTSLKYKADYVLVMPPVNEFPIIQFLTTDKGKWFYEIKERQLMIWLCNPERDSISCIVGAARDNLLENYFVHGYHPIDRYIAMLLSKEFMKDGNF